MTDWSVLIKPTGQFWRGQEMCARLAKKEQKRQRILRAAMNVFSRQGVFNFKMIDVAERAKVGKGTLYEYFPSKDALIVGVFHLIFADYEAFIGARIDNNAQPETKLRQIILASCGFFTDRRERLNLLFDLWAVSVPRRSAKPLVADMDHAYHHYTSWLAGIIDEGIARGEFRPLKSSTVASVILAALDGLMFQMVLGVTEAEPEAIAENLSRTILEGIKV